MQTCAVLFGEYVCQFLILYAKLYVILFAIIIIIYLFVFSQDVLEDPQLCCKGHTFCKECVETYLVQHNNGTCPNDRSIVTVTDLRWVLSLQSYLEGQTVRCPNWDHIEGCQWTGLLSELRRHLEECLFVGAECKNEGCRFQCQWRQGRLHASTCDYALVTCTQCNQQGLRHIDVEHYVHFTCTRSLVVCSLLCQSNIDRYVCNKYILHLAWFFMSTRNTCTQQTPRPFAEFI